MASGALHARRRTRSPAPDVNRSTCYGGRRWEICTLVRTPPFASQFACKATSVRNVTANTQPPALDVMLQMTGIRSVLTQRVSEKIFRIVEGTYRNLHFLQYNAGSTLQQQGSYCQLSGLTWARKRVFAWYGHLRVCTVMQDNYPF